MIGCDYNQVSHIGEHAFKLPDCPTEKDDVLFIDKKDPYWIREEAIKDYRQVFFDFIPSFTKLYQEATLYNQDDELISLNKEDSDWMIWAYEREWKRRTYGVHFKNGNEIVWLSGDHWLTLCWCKTRRPDKKGEYFDYRKFQAWFFYLIWYINNSIHDGLFLSKAKKTGITNLMWMYYLNKATMTKNVNLGAMNITQDTSAKTFRDYFMYAFNGLPLCLKPGIKTKSDVDGTITFGKKANNSKKNSRKKSSDDELNTTVMCVPTANNAFDIDVFSDIYMDEPPKYKQDFGEIYRGNAAGTNIQDISIGKKWLTSYTPEGDAPSFNSAKELFFDSELRTVKETSNGRTKSGLICVHLPAYQSWGSSFDKYGDCNEVDAMRKIQAERDQIKDKPRELLTLTRRYANDKREAWSTGGVGSVFDSIRLAELKYNVEEEQRNAPEKPYKEGRLEWINKIWESGLKNRRPKGIFGKVEFIPLSHDEKMRDEIGRLRIYNEIHPSLLNAVLRSGFDEYGCLIPPKEFKFVYGADPTMSAAASEVLQGSKNAFIIKSRRDERMDTLLKRVASNRFDMVYFDRPELPDEAYEDLIKMIIWVGAIGICEANVPNMATRIIEEGLGGFMLVKNENGIIMPWERYMGLGNEPDKKYHLIRTTANGADTRTIMEDFVSYWKMYITKRSGEKDLGATIKDERILEQLENIDITNTKMFDLFMAGGYALMADEIYTTILLSRTDGDYSIYNIQTVLNAIAS